MNAILRIFLAPTVRAILQVLGGANAATDDNVKQVAGAVVIILTLVWSSYEKYKNDKQLSAARGVPTS